LDEKQRATLGLALLGLDQTHISYVTFLYFCLGLTNIAKPLNLISSSPKIQHQFPA